MLAFFTCGRPFGQQPTRKAVNLTSTALSLRSRLGKWLRVGLVAGLAAFDDATNSDRKV
jgi:hypothetical protein